MASLWSAVSATVSRVGTADPLYVLAVLGLYVVSLFITGARWRGFLGALGGEVSLMRASLAMLGGIAAGNLTPSRIGTEPCRVALVGVTSRLTWAQVALATGWDRLSEVPPVAVLIVMSLLSARGMATSWRSTVLAVAAAVLVVAVVLGIRRARRSPTALRAWMASLQLDKVRPAVFAAGVGYSTLLWLQDVLRLACAARAVGVHLAPEQTAMLAVSQIVGGLIPSIGGLVVVEGGLVATLVAFGVDLPTAMAATAVERAISWGFSTVAGGAVVFLMGGRSLWGLVRRGTSGAETPG